MDLDEYIKYKKIYVSKDYLTDIESLLLLLKDNRNDIIKYPFMKKLLISNISVMEKDNEGKYYYDYELKRDCDIVSDFILDSDELDIKISFICGLNEYEMKDINKLLLASCIYSPIKLRITFNDEIKKEKEIKISCYKYLCNRDISYYLMKNKIITPAIIYNDGICIKNYLDNN
jgi:hypothetical protein